MFSFRFVFVAVWRSPCTTRVTISGWMVAFLFRLALHILRMDDAFELSGRPLSCTLTVSSMDGDFLILVCGSRK